MTQTKGVLKFTTSRKSSEPPPWRLGATGLKSQ